jgi:hypothetical protein
MNNRLEKDVVKNIKMTLQLYCPEVIWVDRLQSGTVQMGDRYIHMCKEGTPDLYVIIKKGCEGKLLFVECKSKTGKQSDIQKIFQYRIIGLSNIFYLVARNVGEVTTYIREKILV